MCCLHSSSFEQFRASGGGRAGTTVTVLPQIVHRLEYAYPQRLAVAAVFIKTSREGLGDYGEEFGDFNQGAQMISIKSSRFPL